MPPVTRWRSGGSGSPAEAAAARRRRQQACPRTIILGQSLARSKVSFWTCFYNSLAGIITPWCNLLPSSCCIRTSHREKSGPNLCWLDRAFLTKDCWISTLKRRAQPRCGTPKSLWAHCFYSSYAEESSFTPLMCVLFVFIQTYRVVSI